MFSLENFRDLLETSPVYLLRFAYSVSTCIYLATGCCSFTLEKSVLMPLNIVFFVMLRREIERHAEREIKAELFHGSYAVYFAGTLKIICSAPQWDKGSLRSFTKHEQRNINKDE